MNMWHVAMLPKQGKQDLVELYNRCEESLAWPRRALQAPAILLPKDAEGNDASARTGGGDRALALWTWFARARELLNRNQVRDWAMDVEGAGAQR